VFPILLSPKAATKRSSVTSKQAAQTLAHRVGLFCALPIEKLDRLRLKTLVEDIQNQ
jgi:hypothetical protein